MKYQVTNSAGGTELCTKSRERAISKFNKLEFPGDVITITASGEKEALTFELNEDGQWVEA
jgi:hypothetical protein